MPKHIWVIDDEQAICWALKKSLEQTGYRVTTFSNAEDAFSELREATPLDAVMLDMRMPGMDGFAATKLFKQHRPALPIIMMTAFGDLGSAMQAMELDIFEYLTKPFELSDGLKAVAKAVSQRNSTMSAVQVTNQVQHDTLLGSSPAMQSVYKQMAIASKSDVSVFIQGPSGIGKEAIAAAIHRHSDRSGAPFLVFSALSIPPISLAMELLGSVQGPSGGIGKARTDSESLGMAHFRSGAFELAGEGILYVDEVGDLPISLQSQLLRVLEHREFTPLGSVQSHRCHARVIVSSSRSLDELESDGELLRELRHRLSVFVIEVKSLAERREDIVQIASSILNREDSRLGFSTESEGWLKSREWSGNIRELKSAILHAILVSRGATIGIEDLEKFPMPSAVRQHESDSDFAEFVRRWTFNHLAELDKIGQRVTAVQSDEVFGTMYEDFLSAIEPPFLEAMMAAFQGNRAAIASQLGLHRSTLRQKMRRYKID